MDIIRRNTDYSLRLMIALAESFGREPISASKLAVSESVSPQLTSKLLQKLHLEGLIGSRMGPKGGFYLKKDPSKISMADIVNVIQGPVCVNMCILDRASCSRHSNCSIRKKLKILQKKMEQFYEQVTLNQLIPVRHKKYKINVKNQIL